MTVLWSKNWLKLDAKMKASVCSKEYASTLCDLFLYLIVLKGCYLNIKKNYAQTRSRRSYSGFSMNTETENYLASTDFFFRKYSQGKLFGHSRGNLAHTNYNTLVGSTSCKCKCFRLFIMLYNKFKWLNVHCGVVDVLGKLLRTWRIHY